MICTEFLKPRVSPGFKLQVKTVADPDDGSGVARLLLREIRTAKRVARPPLKWVGPTALIAIAAQASF
jgi:hypothetical protein